MGPTKSDFANFILISFLIIIAITLITIRVKNIIIEISRKKEKEKYEEQRKIELLMYEKNCIYIKKTTNG
ncbi:MAG: hypothetical protein JHC31_09485 [Sulfurihydrogenibium sp.]|nr:hypothetical protein [Sulfurihydrogenibium sp.]